MVALSGELNSKDPSYWAPDRNPGGLPFDNSAIPTMQPVGFAPNQVCCCHFVPVGSAQSCQLHQFLSKVGTSLQDRAFADSPSTMQGVRVVSQNEEQRREDDRPFVLSNL